MAKLTKTEAINAARSMATGNAEVVAMTVETLEKMTYQDKRTRAAEIQRATAVARIDTLDKYMGEVMQAFENRALDMWAAKINFRQNARRAFKTACDGIDYETARERIAAFFKSLNVRGAYEISGDRLEIRRGRCSATLYVRLEADHDNPTVNPDNEQQRAYAYRLSVEFSTSGTTYSPAEMAVVVRIQQELLDAANELLVVMDRVRVVRTWGVPAAATTEAL